MRRLTVGRISRRRRFPQIRIQGKWLERLGWQIGDKVEVLEDGKETVLRRIHVEDFSSKQLHLPHTEHEAGDATQAEGGSPCSDK